LGNWGFSLFDPAYEISPSISQFPNFKIPKSKGIIRDGYYIESALALRNAGGFFAFRTVRLRIAECRLKEIAAVGNQRPRKINA
jgi:hypothetical protein